MEHHSLKISIFSLLLIIGFFSLISEDKNIFLTIDDERFNNLLTNADMLYDNDSLGESLIYSYKALYLAQKLEDPEKITKSYMRMFLVQYASNNFARSIESAKKAIIHAPDNTWKYRNHYNAGLGYMQLEKYDSALYYFNSSYEYFLEIKDPKSVMKNLNYIGISYYFLKEYSKARAVYFDLLDYSSHQSESRYIGYSLNNIGNSYLKEGKSDSAVIYLERSLEYLPQNEMMRTFTNLAKASEDKYQYLLKAKEHYYNSIDREEYLTALQELRLLQSHPDSILQYAVLISDLVMEMNEDRHEISALSSKLLVANIENQIKFDQIQRAKQRERLRIIWMASIAIFITIVIAVLIILIFKKKWIPKNASYKIELLNYQVREIEKTLKQFMDLKN